MQDDWMMIQRLLIRLEAMHVLGSLMGICASWLALDVLLNLRHQIGPSVAMWMVSMVAFGLIVHVFPEQDCVVVAVGNVGTTTAAAEEVPPEPEERV
jgi:predicted acyltransferase